MATLAEIYNAAFGDTRPLRGIITSSNGTDWTLLHTAGTFADQPICFYDVRKRYREIRWPSF